MTKKFAEELAPRLGLMSATVKHGTGENSLQAVSVKVVEVTQGNVMMDINVL